MRPLCVISGGTSGIGFEISKSLVSKYDLALIYRSNDEKAFIALGELEKFSAGGVKTFKGDLSVIDETERLSKEIEDWRSAAPSVLVNATTLGQMSFFSLEPVEAFHKSLNDELYPTVNLTHCMVKKMMAGGHGKIINFSSVAAEGSSVAIAGYSVAKSAIETLTKVLAREVFKRGVRVNCIRPALISVSRNKNVVERVDKDLLAQVSDIIGAVEYLLNENTTTVSGTVVTVNNILGQPVRKT